MSWVGPADDYYRRPDLSYSHGSDKETENLYRRSCTSASSSDKDSLKNGLTDQHRAHSCAEICMVDREMPTEEQNYFKNHGPLDRRGSV